MSSWTKKIISTSKTHVPSFIILPQSAVNTLSGVVTTATINPDNVWYSLHFICNGNGPKWIMFHSALYLQMSWWQMYTGQLHVDSAQMDIIWDPQFMGKQHNETTQIGAHLLNEQILTIYIANFSTHKI